MHYSLKIINPNFPELSNQNGYFRANPSYGEILPD